MTVLFIYNISIIHTHKIPNESENKGVALNKSIWDGQNIKRTTHLVTTLSHGVKKCNKKPVNCFQKADCNPGCGVREGLEAGSWPLTTNGPENTLIESLSKGKGQKKWPSLETFTSDRKF